MNGAEDGATHFGVALEQLDQTPGHEGVETGSRFVAEDQRRFAQDLRGKGQPLRFPTGNAFDLLSDTNQHILALLEPHLHHDVLNAIANFFRRRHQHSQIGVKHEMFPDRQRANKDVRLLDEDGHVGHLLLVDHMSVDHDLPADVETAAVLKVEDVEQRCLARPGGPHQRHETARVDDALDVGEDVLWWGFVRAFDAILHGDAAP